MQIETLSFLAPWQCLYHMCFLCDQNGMIFPQKTCQEIGLVSALIEKLWNRN